MNKLLLVVVLCGPLRLETALKIMEAIHQKVTKDPSNYWSLEEQKSHYGKFTFPWNLNVNTFHSMFWDNDQVFVTCVRLCDCEIRELKHRRF